MIRNIVFDIGNVLVAFDWKGYFTGFGYSQDVVDRLAKATVLTENWLEYDRGVLSEEEVLQRFIDRDPQLEPLIRESLSSHTGLLVMYDYAIPWIQELKSKGYGVYYLSNYSYPAYRDCSEEMKFIPYTDGGILSFQEHLVKPDAAIYELLLERYDLKAKECVFLDDTEKNIIGARNVGMQGIVFRNKQQAEEELRRLGVETT